MQHFKLTDLATRPKGTVVRIPAPTGTLTAEYELRTAIRAMLREMASYVRETVLPTYTRLAAEQRASLRDDVAGEGGMEGLTKALVAVAMQTVTRILGLEGKRHTAKWKANVKRVLSIDLDAVVREEDLEQALEAITSRNAALITGLADSVRKDIGRAVSDAYLRGEPASKLRKTLGKTFGLADNRAKLIARDQTATAASEMTQLRHRQAGITHFFWRTSSDERVRSLHNAINGKRYQYGKPTDAEQGLPPGGPIQCRCTGEGEVAY